MSKEDRLKSENERLINELLAAEHSAVKRGNCLARAATAWKAAAEDQVQAGLDMVAWDTGLGTLEVAEASCEKAGASLNAARKLEKEQG